MNSYWTIWAHFKANSVSWSTKNADLGCGPNPWPIKWGGQAGVCERQVGGWVGRLAGWVGRSLRKIKLWTYNKQTRMSQPQLSDLLQPDSTTAVGMDTSTKLQQHEHHVRWCARMLHGINLSTVSKDMLCSKHVDTLTTSLWQPSMARSWYIYYALLCMVSGCGCGMATAPWPVGTILHLKTTWDLGITTNVIMTVPLENHVGNHQDLMAVRKSLRTKINSMIPM